MASFGFCKYLRLKILVTTFRTLSGWRQRPFLQPPEHVQRKFLQVTSRDKDRAIDAWLYYPNGHSDGSATSPKPVLINWHGSGFVNPSLGLDYDFCSQIARGNNILVLDVDYRKAPEHPYPAAIEDVEDVLTWVGDQQSTIDISRVAVSGFSSGGALALIAASLLREDHPKLDIKSVVALYPCTDLANDAKTKTVTHPIRPLPPWILNVFYDSYAPSGSSRKDPRISPLYADPSLFPERVTIVTCSGDTLKPEADALADKLSDRHRRVNLINILDMPHGFDKGCLPGSREWDKKELAYERISSDLREALL